MSIVTPEIQPSLVIVPKRDELQQTLAAFDLSPLEERTGELGDTEFWEIVVAKDVRVLIACLESQGNLSAYSETARLISSVRPGIVALTGTALGNPDYGHVGSVYAARSVRDLTEIRYQSGSITYSGSVDIDAHRPVRRDLEDFVADPTVRVRLQEAIQSQFAGQKNVSCAVEPICSGNSYYRDNADKVREDIWSHFPQARAYDMESIGVVRAAESSETDWVVFRGISDFGDPASIAEGNRELSSFSSALWLSEFLRADRVRMRTVSTRASGRIDLDRLPETNIYARESSSVSNLQDRISRDLNITLDNQVLDRSLTMKDLQQYLSKRVDQDDEIKLFLPIVREEYFRDKYLSYSYTSDDGVPIDTRGIHRDWAREIRRVIEQVGVPSFVGKSVIDVGCGNGIELGPLFNDADSLTLVDISKDMVQAALESSPVPNRTVAVPASADQLDGISDDSFDVYLSLRCFQSRLLDIDAAVREAYRITRPGGVVAISLSNGYAGARSSKSGTEHFVIPGLKASGNDRTLNKGAPYDLMKRIRKSFAKFDIDSRQVDLQHGELLLCGQLPATYAPGYYGA